MELHSIYVFLFLFLLNFSVVIAGQNDDASDYQYTIMAKLAAARETPNYHAMLMAALAAAAQNHKRNGNHMWTEVFNNIDSKSEFPHRIQNSLKGQSHYSVNDALFKYDDKLDMGSITAAHIIQFYTDYLGKTLIFPSMGKVDGSVHSVLHAESVQSLSVSRQCSRALRLMLTEKQKLALKMLDASGKLNSGLENGNLLWVGDFDECLEVAGHMNISDNVTTVISGQYCKALLKLPVNAKVVTSVQLSLGLCVPNACNSTDIEDVINSSLRFLPPLIQNVSVSCYQEDIVLTTEAIVCIVICSLFGTLLLAGSLYDIVFIRILKRRQTGSTAELFSRDEINDGSGDLAASGAPGYTINADNVGLVTDSANVIYSARQNTDKSGLVGRVLVCFSLVTNIERLLRTDSAPGSLLAVNGIRVLSLGWVILGHSFVFILSVARNVLALFDMPKKWSFQPILNGFYAVDTFFLLSGLLVTYGMLRQFGSGVTWKSPRTWIVYYCHRFIRLTPAYMLIMMLYTCLFQYWVDGPFWLTQSPDYKACHSYWWRNLLYINNFFPSADMCCGWSWYLANDMQFHWISPPFLIALASFPVVGIVLVTSLLLCQVIYRGVMSTYYGLGIGEIGKDLVGEVAQPEWFQYYYMAPYARIAPFLIGMLLGYALQPQRRPARIHKVVVMIGWALTMVLVISLTYSTYHELQGPQNYNAQSLDSFFNAMSKVFWGVAIAWIIFACNTGYGGFMTRVLSWPAWTPLARLTYCAYLLHPIVMWTVAFSLRTSIYVTQFYMVLMFLAFWMLSYGLAFLASLAFESPIMALEKIFLPR